MLNLVDCAENTLTTWWVGDDDRLHTNPNMKMQGVVILFQPGTWFQKSVFSGTSHKPKKLEPSRRSAQTYKTSAFLHKSFPCGRGLILPTFLYLFVSSQKKVVA